LPKGHETRIRGERESDGEQLEVLNDLIGRLDGMYKDIRRINADFDWLADMQDACVQLCMAAQTLLEERRDEIRPVTSKSAADYRAEVLRHMELAATVLKNRGDRGIIEGSAEATDG
jgi:hypothetical protein